MRGRREESESCVGSRVSVMVRGKKSGEEKYGGDLAEVRGLICLSG
jgi:hypothetical protein